jgi:hypothetical protein
MHLNLEFQHVYDQTIEHKEIYLDSISVQWLWCLLMVLQQEKAHNVVLQQMIQYKVHGAAFWEEVGSSNHLIEAQFSSPKTDTEH